MAVAQGRKKVTLGRIGRSQASPRGKRSQVREPILWERSHATALETTMIVTSSLNNLMAGDVLLAVLLPCVVPRRVVPSMGQLGSLASQRTQCVCSETREAHALCLLPPPGRNHPARFGIYRRLYLSPWQRRPLAPCSSCLRRREAALELRALHARRCSSSEAFEQAHQQRGSHAHSIHQHDTRTGVGPHPCRRRGTLSAVAWPLDQVAIRTSKPSSGLPGRRDASSLGERRSAGAGAASGPLSAVRARTESSQPWRRRWRRRCRTW